MAWLSCAIEWPGLEGTLKILWFQPPAVRRDTFRQTGLLGAAATLRHPGERLGCREVAPSRLPRHLSVQREQRRLCLRRAITLPPAFSVANHGPLMPLWKGAGCLYPSAVSCKVLGDEASLPQPPRGPLTRCDQKRFPGRVMRSCRGGDGTRTARRRDAKSRAGPQPINPQSAPLLASWHPCCWRGFLSDTRFSFQPLLRSTGSSSRGAWRGAGMMLCW